MSKSYQIKIEFPNTDSKFSIRFSDLSKGESIALLHALRFHSEPTFLGKYITNNLFNQSESDEYLED